MTTERVVPSLSPHQFGQLKELLAWYETAGQLPVPFYRRRQLGGPADRRYTGDLTGAMSTGTASVLVDNIQTIIGPTLVASSSETQLVYNAHSWEADNDAGARFEWNRSTSHFEFYAIDCPST